MAAKKDIMTKVESLIKSKKKGELATFENIASLFEKQITAAQAKKIVSFAKAKKLEIVSASEFAKAQTELAKTMRAEARAQQDKENQNDEFDITKEKELLEWSRSDSPVRMYLREMGKIPLLTKEEEVTLSRQIEDGEDIIIDAICSVPYLVDYILNYKTPLLNRERRVKELFKNFEDEKASNNDDENEDEVITEEDSTASNKSDNKRGNKVIEAFKHLEKSKKEWIKARNDMQEVIKTDGENESKIIHERFKVAFRKTQLKNALLDLGPTSKLINELVKAMETALKSDDGFDKELSRLEYK